MNELSTHPKRVAIPIAEPAIAVPEPPIPSHNIVTTPHHWGDAHHSLFELLDQSKAIAELLHLNFSNQGGCDRPSEAAGLGGVVQCVATQLTAAEAAANALALPAATRDAIYEAAGLASYLAAESKGTLLDGKLRFNYTDALVGVSYSTLKYLAERAIVELLRKPAA